MVAIFLFFLLGIFDVNRIGDLAGGVLCFGVLVLHLLRLLLT